MVVQLDAVDFGELFRVDPLKLVLSTNVDGDLIWSLGYENLLAPGILLEVDKNFFLKF